MYYSTVSDAVEENEVVVRDSLEDGVRLVHVLKDWPARGVVIDVFTEEQAACCMSVKYS